MMQRISFKHLVFLALLVMSFSLVPSTIIHSAPNDGIVDQQKNQGQEAKPQAPDAGRTLNHGNAEAENDQEESRIGIDVEEQDTLKSLRHDLEQLEEEFKKEKETLLPFGISLEMILAAVALLASVVSIVTSWILFKSLDKDFRRIKKSHHFFEQQVRLSFGGLETEQQRLAAQLKADVQSVQKKQDFFEASSALNSQSSPLQAPSSSSPFTTAVVSNVPENPQPTLTVASLIRAINTGDRQALREATTAELNITSSSENSIVMGMSEATELEEVSAGGSYLLVSLEERKLLLPTDRTLRGFTTTQPNKGLYSYEQQSVAKAEIIEPALLEKNGAVWRVTQKGRVAIP